jgi:hypothetical protein
VTVGPGPGFKSIGEQARGPRAAAMATAEVRVTSLRDAVTVTGGLAATSHESRSRSEPRSAESESVAVTSHGLVRRALRVRLGLASPGLPGGPSS